MPLRFNIGPRRGGGLGIRKITTYELTHWRRTHGEGDVVEYRPSARTFIYHGRTSLMAAIVVAVILWYAGLPWNARTDGSKPSAEPKDTVVAQPDAELARAYRELEQQLSPERRDELRERQARRVAALAASRERLDTRRAVLDTLRHALHWISLGALSLIAVVPLVNLPLTSLVIEHSPAEELIISRRGLWPATRRWPVGTFRAITFDVEADTFGRRYRRGRYVLGWRWVVRLTADRRSWLTEGPSIVDDPEIMFHVDYQKMEPVDPATPSPAVAYFLRDLQRVLRIDCAQPFSHPIEVRSTRFTEVSESLAPGLGGRRRRSTTTRTEGVPLDSQALGRLIKQVRASGGEIGVRRSRRITVRDAAGNEQTYDSADDLPPNIRAHYNRLCGDGSEPPRRT